MKVFHSYGKWGLSGVNTWSVNLIRGLNGPTFDQTVLFTGIPQQACLELDELEIPYIFLDLPRERSRRSEWRELKRFLEENSPCIYIPNYDFHRSCAIGTLAPGVSVCMVVHSDEDCYFDEIRRLGKDLDAIVCVSSYLAGKVERDFPELAGIVSHVPYGIPIIPLGEAKQLGSGELRLAYCNRLQQYQKRVFDLPEICKALEADGIGYHLTVAGEGPDRAELEKRFLEAGLSDRVNFVGRVSNSGVVEILRGSDVFLLTSDFEGLPISLLEAMSMGVVPIAYRIKSGVDEVIEHGTNGLLIPHGNKGEFAKALAGLAADRRRLDSLSSNARDTASTKFSLKRMCADYSRLFETLAPPAGANQRLHRSGRIRLPKDITFLARADKYIRRTLLKK